MSDTETPISRLNAVSDAPEDRLLAALFQRIRARSGRLLNIHRVVGHAPKILQAQAAYAAALRADASLPRDFQELLILRIAQVNDSAYEQSAHRPVAIACGVPPAKIAALPSWRSASLFDARERAALAFVDQAARNGVVEDAVFAAARQVFSPQELVEITAFVGWYTGNSRFVRALQIAAEAER